jgi:hypothetical protein
MLPAPKLKKLSVWVLLSAEPKKTDGLSASVITTLLAIFITHL